MVPGASVSPPSSSWHLAGPELGFIRIFMKNNSFVVWVFLKSIFFADLHFFRRHPVFKPGKYAVFHF